jgi:hypothetical protein
MRARTVLFGLGVLLASVPGLGQTPAAGPEFVANGTTASAQSYPDVSIGTSGNFVVVWEGSASPSGFSIFVRPFSVFGAPQLAEFPADSSAPGDKLDATVSKDGTGDFVVAWTSYDQDGSESGIFARLFDSSGAPKGSEFQVNTYTPSYQYLPRVATDPAGNFVIVWSSYEQDGDGGGVYARRYNAAGVAQGAEFRVNTQTLQDQYGPSVAMDASGDFVVAWSSFGQDGSGDSVFAKRFNSAGVAQGGEFQVNTFTAGDQTEPRIGMDSSGRFVIVWASAGDGNQLGIFGRRYDAAGLAQGGEFLVNTVTAGIQTEPAVAMDSAGNFVAAWSGPAGIFGQRFDSFGRRSGSEFQIGSLGLGASNPNVSLNATGNFVVAWDGTDGSGSGAEARRAEFSAAGVMGVDEAGNRVLEAGESVAVEPAWTNTLREMEITGTASGPAGPPGGIYTLNDSTADYGSLAQGAAANCETATGDCYQMTVSGSTVAAHWDARFLETLSDGFSKTWSLHVGESFEDVPTSQLFYRAIESVFHAGITTGCTPTEYCPEAQVTRSQMSLFLGRGVAGGGQFILSRGFVGANAYNCAPGGTSLFTDVPPTASFCRSVHYLAAQNVTTGCSPTQYCPNPIVTRGEMSRFVARAVVAPGGGDAVPVTYGPDPVTGFSYSCNPASPDIHFTDVPASNDFCKHAHFLWARGIISGCSPTEFCLNLPVTRDAMARFLANGFSVSLYGP